MQEIDIVLMDCFAVDENDIDITGANFSIIKNFFANRTNLLGIDFKLILFVHTFNEQRLRHLTESLLPEFLYFR
jgi:hypothetical protein